MPPVTRRMSRISAAESHSERSEASPEIKEATPPVQDSTPTPARNSEPLPGPEPAKVVPADAAERAAAEGLAEGMEDMDIDEVTAALHRSEDEDEQFEGEGEGDEDEEDEGEDYETKYYAEDPDDGKAELDEKGRIRDRKGADEGEEEEEGERVEGEEDDEEDDAGPSELIIDNDPETRRTELPAVTQTIAITEPLASSSDAVDRPLEARHSTTGVYIPPFEPTGQYVTYRCAMYDCDNPANLDKEQARAYACGNVQRCRRGESLRCRMCGGNIMEKVRTERMVQFQAI